MLLFRDSDFYSSVFQCNSLEKSQAYNIDIPTNLSWSTTFTGNIGELNEPHIWFIVLADCNRVAGEFSKISVELNIKSGDQSELPVEMKGMKRIYSIVCIIFTLLLGRNIYKLYKHFYEEQEIESVLVMLNISVVCKFFSMIFYILHISAYESNGRGIGAFQFFGSAGNFLCDFIMIFLLLLIAQGWSITFRDFPTPEIYFVVMVIVGFLHLILSIIEMILSDSYFLFSNYEGILGVLILISRILMVL